MSNENRFSAEDRNIDTSSFDTSQCASFINPMLGMACITELPDLSEWPLSEDEDLIFVGLKNGG